MTPQLTPFPSFGPTPPGLPKGEGHQEEIVGCAILQGRSLVPSREKFDIDLSKIERVEITGLTLAFDRLSLGCEYLPKKFFWKKLEQRIDEGVDVPDYRALESDELIKFLNSTIDKLLHHLEDSELLLSSVEDISLALEKKLCEEILAFLMHSPSYRQARLKLDKVVRFFEEYSLEASRDQNLVKEIREEVKALSIEGGIGSLKNLYDRLLSYREKSLDLLMGERKRADVVVSFLSHSAEPLQDKIRGQVRFEKDRAGERVAWRKEHVAPLNISLKNSYLSWQPESEYGPDRINKEGWTLDEILRGIVPSNEVVSETLTVFGRNFLEYFEPVGSKRLSTPADFVRKFISLTSKWMPAYAPEGDPKKLADTFYKTMIAEKSAHEDGLVGFEQFRIPDYMRQKGNEKQLEKWTACFESRVVMGGRFKAFREKTPLFDLLKGLAYGFSSIKRFVEDKYLNELCTTVGEGFCTSLDREFNTHHVIDEVTHLGKKRLVVWHYRRFLIRHRGKLAAPNEKSLKLPRSESEKSRKRSLPGLNLVDVIVAPSESRSGPLPPTPRLQARSSIEVVHPPSSMRLLKTFGSSSLPERGPLPLVDRLLGIKVNWSQSDEARDYGAYTVALGIYPPIEAGGEWEYEYVPLEVCFPRQPLWISQKIVDVFKRADSEVLKKCRRS